MPNAPQQDDFGYNNATFPDPTVQLAVRISNRVVHASLRCAIAFAEH